LNWIGPDLRGRILKEFAPKPPRFTPWLSSVSAARKQPGRYVPKRVSEAWNFRVHLDLDELDAADQFFNDWVLAGLRYSKPVDSTGCAEVRGDSAGGQVPKRDSYGDFDRHDHTGVRAPLAGDLRAHGTGELNVIATDSRSHEGHAALSEADLRAMAQPRNDAESAVGRLVDEFLKAGGTVKLAKGLGGTDRRVHRAAGPEPRCWRHRRTARNAAELVPGQASAGVAMGAQGFASRGSVADRGGSPARRADGRPADAQGCPSKAAQALRNIFSRRRSSYLGIRRSTQP
jgi:hypothetical protein